MKNSLQLLANRIADHLGIDALPIKFEDIYPDDSRLYIDDEYIAISNTLKDNYEECAKSIAHEFRHIFQMFYADIFNNDRAKRWKDALSHPLNSMNLNNTESYLLQELELDAFAFTKYYLEKYEGISVVNKIEEYNILIDRYINNNQDIM